MAGLTMGLTLLLWLLLVPQEALLADAAAFSPLASSYTHPGGGKLLPRPRLFPALRLHNTGIGGDDGGGRSSADVASSSPLSSSQSVPANEAPASALSLFPVLGRIAGINWSGECRYVGADLRPATNLKLVGGVRYDIEGKTCTLSSFLTFPNGKTREVVMRGERRGLSSAGGGGPESAATASPVRLDSIAEGGGPIYMVLTELEPGTVLINEVDSSNGLVVMTSSLSIVNGGTELVQVSHEVGTGTGSGGAASGNPAVEGHQVWRLKRAPIHFDDFDVRGATGR